MIERISGRFDDIYYQKLRNGVIAKFSRFRHWKCVERPSEKQIKARKKFSVIVQKCKGYPREYMYKMLKSEM